MMSGIQKSFPSKGPKVRYMSVKSGLPELFGIQRRIRCFSADQVSFVTMREFPNTRRWSG
eukprot:12410002-Karenia_brevis.AAC.1